MDRFGADEIAIIRKFLGWVDDGKWLDNSPNYETEGVTGCDNDGITITGFNAVDDYGGASLDRDYTHIPWLALTDPEAYARQCAEEKAQRKREEAARHRAHLAQIEAAEREQFERLRAKFAEPPPA